MSREQKRRTADQEVALIVVDRVLDLAGPAVYSDCLIDLLYDCCFRLSPGQSFSVFVDPPLDAEDAEIRITDQKIPIMTDIREAKHKEHLQYLFSSLMPCFTERETLITLRLEAIFSYRDAFLQFFQSIDRNPAIPEGLSLLNQLEYLASILKDDRSVLYHHEAFVAHLLALYQAYCKKF